MRGFSSKGVAMATTTPSTSENATDRGSEIEAARIRAAYARRPRDGRYSWFHPGQLYLAQELERRLLALLSRQGFAQSLDTKRILEVGCGRGFWLGQLIKWGARPEFVAGVDLLPNRIAEARCLCPPGVRLELGNAERLGMPDAAFDLVLQSTVFTSILDARMKREIAREMLRVLKPDGLIVWYDCHCNNPWNPDVRGVRKGEIRRLFPGCRIRLRRVTLAPPIARRLAPWCRPLCWVLGKIPFFCTHYLGEILKAPTTIAESGESLR